MPTGIIDVFDSSFKHVNMPSWAFQDRHLPKRYAPFNVQTLKGDVFVAYAKPDPATGKAAAGQGLGDRRRILPGWAAVGRVASRQSLNAPWGLAISP
ncbi:TIGR03118 family protein [Actinacidiphila soli]|uniref:TIGR03118 family protein n=1 Tax=Actinacidiphila soli TaxID=2487275 RepID=UPI0019D31721|nr:TIGR03118 family protein [Actinacidiphila soli]